MSTLVLLNLLKELRKTHTMRGLVSIVSLIRKEFINSILHNTRAQMLDSVLLYDVKITFEISLLV